MNILDQTLIRLAAEVKASRNGYARINFHKAAEEDLHIMLIGLRPMTSIIFHRSTVRGFRFYQCLQGELILRTVGINEVKFCTEVLTQESLVKRIDQTVYRSCANETKELVFYLETCKGPFLEGHTVWKIEENVQHQ